MKKRSGKAPSEPSADALFRASVADATPLPARNKAPLRKARTRPDPATKLRAEHFTSSADGLSDHISAQVYEAGEPLNFSKPGLQRAVLRQLRRGGSTIESELDLHGLTVAEARPLLVEFLKKSRRRGLRYVRIIHGKGLRSQTRGGVLKGQVASWLSQWDDVLAFREARPADGGGGAVLVMLKTST